MRVMLVLNWKMAPDSRNAAKELFAKTLRLGAKKRSVGLVVCPPFPYIGMFSEKRNHAVVLGAQDVSVADGEKHTGEVSLPMLASCGIRSVIVGHSERRASGESDATVALKAKRLAEAGLTAIVCVGESLRDDHGSHFGDIQRQLEESLKGFPKGKLRSLVVAYEPLWAIGRTAKDAITPEVLRETVIFIRKVLTKLYGRSAGMAVPILYGGSVEYENVASLARGADVGGFLIGHASLDAAHLKEIVDAL